MLEINDLKVSYRDVVAVESVQFGVESGEAVGIIGPNGAGKTSTLRAICGLVEPASGTVRFDGEDITGMAPEAISKRGIALIPEGGSIFRTLTVAENLMLASKKGEKDAVDSVLDQFPILRDRYKQPADVLSGGESQQLAIARALLLEPRLLILDEPSFGLAPKTIDSVYEILSRLRESGLTILLVEQTADRTIAFADRALVLASGRQRAIGTTEEMDRNPEVREAYFGSGAPYEG